MIIYLNCCTHNNPFNCILLCCKLLLTPTNFIPRSFQLDVLVNSVIIQYSANSMHQTKHPSVLTQTLNPVIVLCAQVEILGWHSIRAFFPHSHSLSLSIWIFPLHSVLLVILCCNYIEMKCIVLVICILVCINEPVLEFWNAREK